MREELTDRQRQVLHQIVRHIERQGYPPTVSELMRHFRFTSPRTVSCHLEALERKGYIRHAGTARGIHLAEGLMPSESGLPIVGRCAAGMPIYSEENVIGMFSLTEQFGTRDEAFMLRVEGDSMKDAGILDGDFVVVKRQPSVAQGELGVAITEEGVTVKRIFVEGDRFRLQPENDTMQPIYVPKTDPNFRIGGKVVGVVRKT